MDSYSDSFSVSSTAMVIKRKYFRTSVKWTVGFIRDRIKQKEDAIICPLFLCSHAIWQLTLYPFAETDETEAFSYAHLYLSNVAPCCESLEGEFTTFFKINVSNPIQPDVYSYVSEKCIFKYGAKTERFSFRSANTLYISFIICVEENVFPVAPLGEPSDAAKDEKKKPLGLGCSSGSWSTDFEELYYNPQYSDVTLKLGEDEFKAHKLVLSVRSKVFAAMFQHQMMENRQNTVDLEQMEVETVQDMLRYIYCGKVRELSPEHAFNLYVAADRYNLQELKAICREVILSDISTSNVCDIAEVADLHNDDSFINALKPFILENGKDIVKTEKWKEMLTKKPLLCGKMFELIFSA